MTLRLLSDNQIREKDIDTLKRFIRVKIGGYRVAISDITTDNLFYRGVRWPQRPTAVDQLSYPPAPITKLGRANRPGNSMFYCSRAAPSVFFELRVRAGDLIALSEWQVTEPLWMHNLGYHQAALSRMKAPPAQFMRARFTNPIPSETKTNNRLRRQLSLAFTDDIHEGVE